MTARIGGAALAALTLASALALAALLAVRSERCLLERRTRWAMEAQVAALCAEGKLRPEHCPPAGRPRSLLAPAPLHQRAVTAACEASDAWIASLGGPIPGETNLSIAVNCDQEGPGHHRRELPGGAVFEYDCQAAAASNP